MYIVRLNGRRWKVREAVSLEAACSCIAFACVTGSVGSKTCLDEGGKVVTLADVIEINSDGSERAPYSFEAKLAMLSQAY